MKIKKAFIFISIFIIAILIFFHFTNENFFDYDEVEHYKKNVTHEELSEIYNQVAKSGKKSIFLDIVENDYPKNVDENFEKSLINNGFKKTILNKSKYEEINNIFSEQNCLINSASACIPIYRDILIFKKNKKTIGVAKICFDCQMFYIIGTQKNVQDFGANGNFEKLEPLLK